MSNETASWVIVDKRTGKPVFETFTASVASAINRDRYEVLAVHDWLIRFNASIRTKGHCDI